MTEIRITITGLDEAVQRVGRMQVLDALHAPMQRAVLDVQARMQQYPPQRSGSSYRRTMTLSRKWTSASAREVTREGNTLRGRVGIRLSYAPLVQSQMYQARVHRGRWLTDQGAIEQAAPAIIADFAQAVRAAFGV